MLFFGKTRSLYNREMQNELSRGKNLENFHFSGYTLIRCICLDAGSVCVCVLDLLDMFATYPENFPFFVFASCVCEVGIFLLSFLCLINLLFFEILLWYHFFNENLSGSQNPFVILLLLNVSHCTSLLCDAINPP